MYWEGEIGVIEGVLQFKAAFDGFIIEDQYNIKIIIPADYPDSLPLVIETGQRIPPSFHKNPTEYGDSLCLEVGTKLKLDFSENPTILFFVNKFVIDYLFSYSYLKKTGHLPYGERPHGVLGIIDFYKEILGISDIRTILDFLKVLASGSFREHQCICKSGKRTRNCHGKIIKKLLAKNIPEYFQNDYDSIIEVLSKNSRP